MTQSLETKRRQELVLDQARQAVGILEDEAQLERNLEEEGDCSQSRPRRSARIQALVVLHNLEQGVQRQLAAGTAGWEDGYIGTELEDNKE